MRISQLIERPVTLLGFGVEGQATLAALRRAGHRAPVTIWGDSAPPQELLRDAGASFVPQPQSVQAVERAAVMVRSPGFAPHHPLRRLADDLSFVQTTATDLFVHEARAAGLRVIGVTGSKGKSTTSTLIERGLAAAGVAAALVGNIGVPPLALLSQLIERQATVVMELSSYQCADLTLGPNVGLLLSLFPEHMDWHGDVARYYAAKLRLLATQRAGDRFYYSQSCSEAVAAVRAPSTAEVVGDERGFHFRDGHFCRGSTRLFSDQGMLLKGVHNRHNACCALAVLDGLGVDPHVLTPVLSTFAGLPYRLQDEGVNAGIRFLNDSISTAPEATVAALAAFPQRPLALIVGGYDRGYDLAPLLSFLRADAASERPIAHVLALPNTGHTLAAAMRAAGIPIPVSEVEDLCAAVRQAREALPGGGLCLFSPGAPSYGAYRDFAERGRAFSQAVRGD